MFRWSLRVIAALLGLFLDSREKCMPFGIYTIVILILITIPEIPAIIKWVKRKRSVYATGIKERECAKLEAEREKER